MKTRETDFRFLGKPSTAKLSRKRTHLANSLPKPSSLCPSGLRHEISNSPQVSSRRISGSDSSSFLICSLPSESNPHSIQHHDVPGEIVANYLVTAVAQNILLPSSDIG